MPTTQISFRWTDTENDHIRETLDFDTGDVPTVAEAQEQATKYELLMEAMSGCKIDEISVTFPLTVSSAEAADSGYSVYSGATLSFQNSDGVGDSVYIPGILEAKIANKIVIDSDTEVAEFIDAATGSGANTEEPVSTRGSAALWTLYKKGKRATRKA
jgi:hypothetical protein